MLRVSRQAIDVLGQKASNLRVATQAVDVIGTTDPYIRVYRLAVEFLRSIPTGGATHEVGAGSSLGFTQDTSSNIKPASAGVSLSFLQEAACELVEVGRAAGTIDISQTATASLVKRLHAAVYLACGTETAYIGPKSAHAESLLVLAQSTRFPQSHELFVESLLSVEQAATPGGTKRLAAASTLGISDIADNLVKLRAANTPIAFTQIAAVEKIITVASRLEFFQEVVLGAVSAQAQNQLELLQTARHAPLPQAAASRLDLTQQVRQNIRNLWASSALVVGQSESVQKPIRAEAASQLFHQEWLPDGSGSVSLQDVGLAQECQAIHLGCIDVGCVISFSQAADPMLIRADGTDVGAASTLNISQEARFVETGWGETSLVINQQVDVLAGRPGNSLLEITQEAVVNISQGISSASQVEIREAATFTLNPSTVVNQYSPFIGASTDPNAPTPPPASLQGPLPGLETPFQLLFPTTGAATDTLTLKTPNLGNIDRLSFNRVQRETRGGTLVIFSDPIWPKIQTLVLSFSALRRDEAQGLLTFMENHLGQEIGLLDWEHRYWRGVIVTPDEAVVEDARGYFTAGFEFQGELDSTWSA